MKIYKPFKTVMFINIGDEFYNYKKLIYENENLECVS